MKIILYLASSVDGFIAKPNGDTPWSDIVWNEYYTFVKSKKNIIVGHKTYDLMKEVGEFEKIGNPFTVVVSTNLKEVDGAVIANSIHHAVKIMEQKGFDEVVVGGGALLANGFLKSGLVDEIHLFIESQIFGTGLKFMEDNVDIKLNLLSAEKLSVEDLKLIYKVNK